VRVLGWMIVGIGTTLVSTASQAQICDPKYPVCIQAYGVGGNRIDCSFTSLPQCQVSASGLSAQCFANHILPRDRRGADVVKKPPPTKSVTSKISQPLEPKKANGTGRSLDQFRLRMPDEMRKKLAEAAMANGRSLNDEIIHRLMQTLEREGTQKKLSDSLKSRSDRLANVEKEIATLVRQLKLRDD
jgi:hypothetical protein